MFSSKCSISISVLCDSIVAQVPGKFVISGDCDYATTIKHPSGCARSVSASGNGWGWILSLLGGYILIGAVYRYYFLGIHSVEAIPNLEFWIGLPQRIKTMFVPATRSRGSYSRDALGAYTPGNHWKGGILESLWAAIQLTLIYVLNSRTNLWSCQDTRYHNESFILSHVLVLGSTVSEWTLTRK